MTQIKLMAILISVALLIPAQSPAKEGWEHVFGNHDLIQIVMANVPLRNRLPTLVALRSTSRELRRVINNDRHLDPTLLDRYLKKAFRSIYSLCDQVPKSLQEEFRIGSNHIYNDLFNLLGGHLLYLNLTPGELRNFLMDFTQRLSLPVDSGFAQDELEILANEDFKSFGLIPDVLSQPGFFDYDKVHSFAFASFFWGLVIGILATIWAFIEVANGNFEHLLATILTPICFSFGPPILLELGHLVFFGTRLIMHHYRSMRQEQANLNHIQARRRWHEQLETLLAPSDVAGNAEFEAIDIQTFEVVPQLRRARHRELEEVFPAGSKANLALMACLSYLQITAMNH